MAFDQSTRNRLQRFVAEARSILTEEFTRQLQANYGLDPKSGGIAELDTLKFLDNQGQQTAVILRETLAHYVTSISAKSEKERNKQALDRIIREQAFTVLNRLAALRMAEARGFLLETIAKGYSSKGFQLYKSIAGTAIGETGDAYRQFLFSMFDEFCLDLAVLFDRHSSQGRLFPRESSLLALLDQINHFEIEHLWAEDETIGWIYQYFNSQEERKKMRAESQAPRNSRELAVRNQFFTPRYVVEFLTDNTLGRIWYEMTQGKTALVESCRYLVRRPNEIFLKKGESAPITESEDQESLSQEELLKQTVYIPFRELKDPRDLLMLDPACGSMHFGLYAFDLYEKIYEEAWQLEAELGPNAFLRSHELKPLQTSYSSFDEFCKAIPKLIIEHNIHGVDIDPRAVQIAGLSLWQRAQRAWHQMGIKPNQRPTIKKSNVVCAEPMPGNKEILREFTANLNPPVLGQLVETIFDKMQLAGEAGTLLKIEEEIATAINNAKKQFNQEILHKKQEKAGFLPGMAPKREPTLYDFADLADGTNFWDTAEKTILGTLKDYADQAESSDGQKRLFAEDAAKGFAFIDLCRKRFDVVLMNPPFGAPSVSILTLMADKYADIKTDIYGAFIIRGTSLSVKFGFLGAITSRTGFFVSSFQRWREDHILPKVHLNTMLDLGGGVLDSAMVETAAYTLENNPSKNRKPSVFFRLATVSNRELGIINAIPNGIVDHQNPNVFVRKESSFIALPKSPFCYWIPNEVHSVLQQSQAFEPAHGAVYVGVQTDNDERFVRLWSEVPAESLGASLRDSLEGRGWITFLKGDSTSPFYLDHHLTLNWLWNGHELRAATENAPGGRVNNESIYFKPGFSWALRTDYFSPHIVPKGCIPSVSRYEAIPECGTIERATELTAQFSAPIYDFVAKLQMEKWKQPKFIPGVIRNLPVPELDEQNRKTLWSLGVAGIRCSRKLHNTIETCREFFLPWLQSKLSSSIQISAIEHRDSLEDICKELYNTTLLISRTVDKKFKLGDKEKDSNWFCFLDSDDELDNEIKPNPVNNLHNRFMLDENGFTNSIFSWIIGSIFGRWDVRFAKSGRQQAELPNPFEPLPTLPPGMHQTTDGFPLEPKNIPADYPLPIPWSGILVDDESHAEDIVRRVSKVIEIIWQGIAEAIELECCNILGVKKLRDYIRRSSLFFADHLKRYTNSRRSAPIYWPLQTPSGSYTLWVYYHRLNEQTLYTCVNDFVEPKLKTVSDDLNGLRNKTNRSSVEEKELAKLTDLEAELKDFRDELLRLAKFWKPNLNDGVQITAAPLWKLFQHKPWQKKLKETWEKLEKGEYDWAHLAYSIWPERVLRKCYTDRSLAIAHDVEHEFWEEVEIPIIRSGKDTGETKLEWQQKKLSPNQLRDLISRIMGNR